MFDYLSSASRAGVGAFGTGVARGAYEEAVRFARDTVVAGKPLIDHEWAQMILSDMYTNVVMARLTYIESNYANGRYGMFKLLQAKPIYYATKYTPKAVLDSHDAADTGHAALHLDVPQDQLRPLETGAPGHHRGTELHRQGLRHRPRHRRTASWPWSWWARRDCATTARSRNTCGTPSCCRYTRAPNEINRLGTFKSFVAHLAPNVTMFEE